MNGADASTRNAEAGEHLQLLRSLAGELERAMAAIAGNNLDELEDSVANQQTLSLRLSELADLVNAPAPPSRSPAAYSIDENFKTQLRAANAELQNLNRRYASLLKHSSRSVAMMASLFSSFRGQFQEASGARLKHQTWSCQM
jgi:aconitase A